MKFEDFDEIFEYFESAFCWPCDVPNKQIFEIAKKNYPSLTENKTKNRFLIRQAGQSGSGKTTQLLPASNAYFEKQGMNPIHFAVREFANLHPDFNQIIEQFGKQEMREKTNGFALKCLFISLAFAIEDGFDISFEVTLLSHEFEDFILNAMKKNNYQCLYLVMAVNKEISNYFIESRRKSQIGAESNRIVYASSSNYFDMAISDEIEYYSKNHGEIPVIIWDAYHELPVFDGSFKDCKKPFFEAKKNTSLEFSDEQKLRDAKINYVLNKIN